jgi:hypothetical protein
MASKRRGRPESSSPPPPRLTAEPQSCTNASEPASPRDPEDLRQRATLRAEIYSQGVNSLFALNGGGSVALGTLITQVLLAPSAIREQIPGGARWAVVSLGLTLLGLALAAPINPLRYECSRLHDNASTRARGVRLGRFHRWLFGLSLACFVLACLSMIGALIEAT